MIAEHFTRRWQNAGLIDEALARRIVAWETTHRRPVLLWAIAGTGALAMSLGVMAIVGANWENIPAWLKLAVDIGLNAVLAVAVFAFWRRERLWLREISALLLFAMVLSGIALIGQIYQLQSAPWRALTLWLALSTPFLAFAALTRLSGVLWAIAAITTWFMAEAPLQELFVQIGVLKAARYYWQGGFLLPLLGYLAGCLLVVLAVVRGIWAPARGQADLLLKLGWAVLIVACSLTVSLSWSSRDSTSPVGPVALAAIATLPAGLALWFGRVGFERRASLAFLIASFALWSIGLHVSSDRGMGADLVRALLFILYWAGIGALAARSGWRGWFGFAFTVIGLRLLILYFQAIGGLTATGLGLIGGGVLCLALTALGWRLTRGVQRQSTGAAR